MSLIDSREMRFRLHCRLSVTGITGRLCLHGWRMLLHHWIELWKEDAGTGKPIGLHGDPEWRVEGDLLHSFGHLRVCSACNEVKATRQTPVEFQQVADFFRSMVAQPSQSDEGIARRKAFFCPIVRVSPSSAMLAPKVSFWQSVSLIWTKS